MFIKYKKNKETVNFVLQILQTVFFSSEFYANNLHIPKSK